VGEAPGRPISSVQQHAITNAVAGVQGHAFAVAFARAPLSAHTVPAAQTTSLGTVLRGRVCHHFIIPSECVDGEFWLTVVNNLKTKKRKLKAII